MQNISLTSPQAFTSAFVQATSETFADIRAYWFSDYRRYTQEMREHVFARVSEILRLNAYLRDYYTLDAIFYRGKDTRNFGEHATYANSIEVAIEHENAIRGSEKEMNKLQLFNSPLKVLITYGNESEQIKYLQTYAEIIRGADVFDDISTTRRQLVIFGSIAEGEIVWVSYVYQNGGFEAI